MYIENVRARISYFTESEKMQLAETARTILQERNMISSKVKPSEIMKYLDNFINHKDTKLVYLEGYLSALDRLYTEGGKNALLGQKIRKNNTWRNLLIKITNDRVCPELEPYAEDELMIKEFKDVFITLVETFITPNRDETMQTLQVLKRLFKPK
ncbi:hypothetical protein [Metabacillus hrfriensis]|uniref:Uncharacterized protein n=1 Tax=Metabacillus hrfriensis TaxID=3048891 RepID=A0ACD4RHU9_9BACI|nr:hypothetical protein [Metabacillus sp. CT-WN-B3]WHZ60088.1 hypothetical protein QLQ22_12465 [Metabacillus sp. CT-WN-B3]